MRARTQHEIHLTALALCTCWHLTGEKIISTLKSSCGGPNTNACLQVDQGLQNGH